MAKKYKHKINDIISKPELAKILFRDRRQEICEEFYENRWKPKLPIEKSLYDILEKIPKFI